jgi:hypothetical protein
MKQDSKSASADLFAGKSLLKIQTISWCSDNSAGAAAGRQAIEPEGHAGLRALEPQAAAKGRRAIGSIDPQSQKASEAIAALQA